MSLPLFYYMTIFSSYCKFDWLKKGIVNTSSFKFVSYFSSVWKVQISFFMILVGHAKIIDKPLFNIFIYLHT